MKVSHDGRLPAFAQIRRQIEQDIMDKKLMPGERLPSEDELAKRYGVSRMTVRRAIDQLESQGQLKREPGHGTWVIEQPGPSRLAGVTRWSFELIDQTNKVTKQVSRVQEVSPTLRVANLLHTMLGEAIIELTILLSEGDETIGYAIARIPKLLLPPIDKWDLGCDSLATFLSKRFGLEFGKVAERVRAVPAEEETAEILGVAQDSPLLYVDSLVFLTSGIPVILEDTFYRGDRAVHRGWLTALEGKS